MELPAAMLIAVDLVERKYAEAAPCAPLIERPARGRRARASLARGLIRFAHAIAPPEAVAR